MVYALSWFFVLALLALWSLATWALHGMAVWAVTNVGALSGAASGAGAIAWPQWLAPWIPPGLAEAVAELVSGFGPLVDSVLQAAPALAGSLGVVAWVVWLLGGGLLLLLGAGLHVLIALWRHRHATAVPRNGALPTT